MLKGKTVVLGVTGSIAAYNIANLASMLVKQHADVNVIMTHNATNFINPITFETLTGNKCLVDTFDRNFEFNVEHVALAKRADIFMVAPASANVIGKMANGIADDMLTTTMTAKQAVREQGIPFKITMDVPNAETIQAMKDTKNKIGLSKGFSSVSELMEDLDADD